MVFVLAVIVAARYGGTLPGLAATVAGTLLGWYVFIPPRYSFAIANPAEAVDVALFALAGSVISLISGQLRQSFIRSARKSEALRTTVQERERYLRELEAVRDSVTDGLVISELDGDLNYWNEAALDLHGLRSLAEARRMLPEYTKWLELTTDEGFLPLERWPMSRVLNGETLRGYDVRVRHLEQGWERTFSYSGRLARDGGGRPLLAVLTLTDVTERNRAHDEIRRLNAELELRVANRTAQLEASNKELEAFAYSVSHDLRGPLRGIDGWSLALAEDYGPQLDAQAHQYIDRVRREAQRMGTLIDDLLRLSRIGRAQVTREEVDLSALAQKVAAFLQLEHPEREMLFTIEPGVTSQGDSQLLEIALTNLLDNAVKFTATRSLARIEFGSGVVCGETAFHVRDDGVGFDMAHAGALFGPFQRLHSASEFSGSGIGLATVQRIVERHGGRIWAEATPDRGSNFFFTLGAPHEC